MSPLVPPRILSDIALGDPAAAGRLLPLVYAEGEQPAEIRTDGRRGPAHRRGAGGERR